MVDVTGIGIKSDNKKMARRKTIEAKDKEESYY